MNKFLFTMFRLPFQMLSILSPSLAVKRAAKLFFTPRKFTPKPIEEEIKQQATKHRLDSGVVYYTWGEGKPVVFIHGWEGRATQVSTLLNKLGSKYKIIAIDAPAHGESDGEFSHPRLFIEALFEVVNAVGPVHAIIGHSMGGGSAAYAALQGIESENIISIAGPSNFFKVVRDFAQFIGLNGRAKAQFIAHVEEVVGIPYIQLDPTQFPAYPESGFLVLHDEEDKEVSVTHAKAYDDNSVNIEVKITKGLGHRKILFAPQTAESVLDFLERQSSPKGKAA